ncbi:hypothetical protein CMQ_651 [Grosmannia clavigera kw1407]|uniref:DUF6536 domain-containing protein n=1 Tax=Grosmannia clavigera (strain kw1407 / UAMH 11150) TaxID=655863 RepID=F0XC13_GROCL|nr:uncharacterized protein CMQ_651 [Grosmannia clavigera kw1407]EFX03723.1 hypothetical protein CMQ_651 [Grosmannia clavigera kw1407]
MSVTSVKTMDLSPRGHGDWPFQHFNSPRKASERVERSSPTPPAVRKRSRSTRSRQTVHWPFQSIGTMDSILTLAEEDDHEAAERAVAAHPPAAIRPTTWQPLGRLGHLRGAYSESISVGISISGSGSGSSFDRSLVPDYVVNYLRGETPESVAQRQAERRQAGRLADDDDDRELGANLDRQSTMASSAGRSDRLMLEGTEKGQYWRKRNRSQSQSASWTINKNLGVFFRAATTSVDCSLAVLALLSFLLSGAAIVGVVLLRKTGRVTCPTTAPRLLLRALTAMATTASLGSAQFVWQAIGSSPTRAEVDGAHAQRRWLDVGVPSLRNTAHHLLTGRGRNRAIVSIVVMAAALMLAVLQGSIVSVSASSSSISFINTTVLAAVAGLHGLIGICLIGILFHNRIRHHGLHFRHLPLVTLGDAVASFLRDPDPTTAQTCMLSMADVLQGRWQTQAAQSTSPSMTSPRWFRALSLSRWLVTSLVWCILVGLAAAALAVAIIGRNTDLGAFGHITRIVFSSSSSPSSFSLIAGLPHLGLALLYLLVHGHLSVYFLAHEFSLFAAVASPGRGRPSRPLRVSVRPRGFQTSSLYLTLPLPWASLLLLLSAALHFVLGSSVVVVVSSSLSLSLLGFSSLSLVVFLALLLTLAILVLGLGARRSPPALTVTIASDSDEHPVVNPLFLLGGSCSAVISARCHPLSDEVAETMVTSDNRDSSDSSAGPLPIWLRPLAWGPVSASHHDHHNNVNSAFSHCTFTSRPVLPLDLSQSYA